MGERSLVNKFLIPNNPSQSQQKRFSLGLQRQPAKDKEKDARNRSSPSSSPSPLSPSSASTSSLSVPVSHISASSPVVLGLSEALINASLSTSPSVRTPLYSSAAKLAREDSISEMLADSSDPFLLKVIPVFKKLAGANKQLIVISKSASRTVEARPKKDEASARAYTLNNQLVLAQENLNKANEDFLERLRETARDQSPASLVELLNMAAAVASSTSFLVNCCKAVTIELAGRDLFKQVLQATRTVRDALTLAIDSIKDGIPPPQLIAHLPEAEKKLQAAVTTVKQSTMQLVTAQATIVGDNFVSAARKQEILGAVRAAVAASTKLLWLRESGEGEEIVNAAKVTAVTVSQLSAAVLEAANDDLILAYENFRQLFTDSVAALKEALANYIEETKSIFSEKERAAKSSPVFEKLRAAILQLVATTDLLSCVGLANLGSKSPVVADENIAFARKVMDEVSLPPPPESPAREEAENNKDNGEANVNIWKEPADSPANIILNEQGRLRAASLNKLIEKLTSPAAPDMRMVKTFITTYRSFCTPGQIITKLLQRFDVPAHLTAEELPVQLRVCNVLRLWSEAHIDECSPEELAMLENFVETKLRNSQGYSKYGEKISELISKRHNPNTQEIVQQGLIEMKIEPKIPLSPARLLSVFDEIQVARQLTLVDFDIYSTIKPVELLNQAWNKPKLKYRSPNVLRLIGRSTAISMWVASCVLWQPTLKERIRVLTKLINIADHLRKMNNFNSLMALIAGLNTAPIYRLKHTREGLSPQTIKTFQSLEQLMSNNQSFLNYRTALHSVDPPCIPFLGVYLTDLTFSDDANPDEINGLVNFGKWELMYNIIAEIQQYQQIAYNFEYVDHIASFLRELPQNNDRDMFDLSKAFEPKGAAKTDIA